MPEVVLLSNRLLSNNDMRTSKKGNHNVDFTVTTFAYMFLVTETLNHTTNHLEYGGLCFDIINAFADKYNLTYDIVKPINKYDWGYIQKNGTWSGKYILL